MVGVLFIVTIPTEQEERNIELNEKHVKFGHSSNVDISNAESDKSEYGTFKVVSSFCVYWPLSCLFSIHHHHVSATPIDAAPHYIGMYQMCKNQSYQ